MEQDKIIRFYRTAIFGREDDKVKAASRRAYRDMCRTIRFKEGCTDDEKTELYDSALNDIIIPAIMLCTSLRNKDSYDKWHDSLCCDITGKYTSVGHTFHYGQSQKWVNMMMKYLCILSGDNSLDCIYKYLHIPLDSIVINTAQKEPGICKPFNSWSKLTRDEYIDYQQELMDKLYNDGLIPLEWEFDVWMNGI